MSTTPRIYYQDAQSTIWLGDCKDILPQIGSADLVLVDPPYEIVAAGGGIGRRRQYLTDIRGFTDSGFDMSLLDGFTNWMCFCSLAQMPKLIERCSGRWMVVTWNKPNPTPLVNENYLPDTEYIVHSFTKLHGDYSCRSRFIVYPARQGLSHPNQKPLFVIRKLMMVGSREGATILDPFMGSGTTLVAAKQLGRKAIGIEISEKYCAIAVQRLQQDVIPFPPQQSQPKAETLKLWEDNEIEN